jgi:hypothetical protein
MLNTILDFRKESNHHKSNAGRLVVHVDNVQHKNDFITTHCVDNIEERDIQHYLNAHNIEKKSIKKAYFKSKIYAG